jgi:UDP-N-acetylglucosamine acyltransferase
MKVHPTAIVDPQAVLADDVEIGPFCAVGSGVRIGRSCRLGPRVVIQGPAEIGRDNVFHAHVSIGSTRGGRLEIGDSNVLRESVSIAVAASKDTVTRIGSRNRVGVWVSVGVGCRIGDDTLVGPFTTIAEDCEIQDHARFEGLVVIESSVRVGRGSRTHALGQLGGDVPPFMIIDTEPSHPQGLGSFRRSQALEEAHRTIWNSGLSREQALAQLGSKPSDPDVAELVRFLRAERPREDTLG